MNLRQMEHVLLLAEELNFSRAAARAHLSQTAFSRSIQTLEQDIGMRLFDRGTRFVRPTVVGQHVIGRSRDLVMAAKDIRRELGFLSNAECGDLVAGVSPMAADGVLRGILPEMNRRHPGLRIQLMVGNWTKLLDHLEHERIEFFVGHPGNLTQNTRFIVELLRAESASFFCRSEHPLLERQDIMAHELIAYPWVAVQLPDKHTAYMKKFCNVKPSEPLPIALLCDNVRLLEEMTFNTNCVLLTWHSWVKADLDAGHLLDIGSMLKPRLDFAAMSIDCATVRLAARTCSPAAQRMIEMITAGSRKKT